MSVLAEQPVHILVARGTYSYNISGYVCGFSISVLGGEVFTPQVFNFCYLPMYYFFIRENFDERFLKLTRSIGPTLTRIGIWNLF